jgi:hypothetical protein
MITHSDDTNGVLVANGFLSGETEQGHSLRSRHAICISAPAAPVKVAAGAPQGLP